MTVIAHCGAWLFLAEVDYVQYNLSSSLFGFTSRPLLNVMETL